MTCKSVSHSAREFPDPLPTTACAARPVDICAEVCGCSIWSFLPQNAGYVARYAEYARDFGELEDIVVVEEAGSFEGPATMRPGSLRSCAIRWWSSVASPIESIRGAVR